MHFYGQDFPIEGEMRRDEVAQARHHAYMIFSRLFLEGVTAVTLPYATAIPELAAHLPHSFNQDESAADHYNLFHMNLFPFESIFFAEDGLLGGMVATAVLTQYQQAGFQVDATAIAPDHIGHELAFLAFLCGAEADAWEDGLVETAVSLQQRQQTFLTTHLLTWLLPFVQAIHGQDAPFYSALVDLTSQLTLDHYIVQDAATSFAPTLPIPPNLFDDDSTRLKDIATFIITPPYSGFFMSRDDISRLARRHKLPRGFGSRGQMLTNLIKTAVQYDALPQLLAQLNQFVQAQETTLTQQIEAFPQLTPFAQIWIERCRHTRQLLQNMSQQAQNQ